MTLDEDVRKNWFSKTLHKTKEAINHAAYDIKKGIALATSAAILSTSAISCKPDSPINPDPTQDDYTHTIKSTQSSPDGASIKAYDNGKTIKITSIANNSYEITFITQSPEETLDSIVATKDGHKKFKTTNFKVATTTKTLNINLEKIPDETKMFWFYGENSTPTGAEVDVFDDGNNITQTTAESDAYQTTSTALPADNEVDSVVVTAQGYDKQTFKNVSVSEGANKLEFTLTQTTIPAKNIISGTLTNIQTDETIEGAYLLAWNGEGQLIYTQTDENGNYELPSDEGINQIKIIKPGFQTRTTYEEGQETNINWNVYNKSTFPLEAIIQLTNDKTLQWIKDPTIYILKEDQYPQKSYDAIVQLIKDVDGMSLGHTKDLEIKYISDLSEYPGASKEHPAISIKLIEGSNSGWNYSTTSEGREEFMYYAGIRINNSNEIKYVYGDAAEEFGSARLGPYKAISGIDILSQYHFDGALNTGDYQPVDSLVTKYHFTRHNNTQTSTDTGFNSTQMNELDNQQEVTSILRFENNNLINEDYQALPQEIKQEIEQ